MFTLDNLKSAVNIISSTFTKNKIAQFGGVLYALDVTCSIANSTFTYNSAGLVGGTIYTDRDSSFNITGSNFYANKANSLGGIMIVSTSSIHITDGMFDHNSGSLYIASSLTFSGYTRFENCEEPSDK